MHFAFCGRAADILLKGIMHSLAEEAEETDCKIDRWEGAACEP
jgi:hypothetical protein